MPGCNTGCAGGCGAMSGLGRVMMDGARSPVRRRLLADRISASSRAANGAQVNVRLDALPPRDQQGRVAHLCGFEIWGTAQFDTVAATMTAAVPGYQVLGLLQNITLEDVTGHQYLVNCDGRNLRDDILMREYKLLLTDPADIPDADATNLQEVFFLKYAFGQLARNGPFKDTAIPLAAIKARGDDAFRFNIASNLPGSPAGVTWDGFQGTIEVWASLMYLPIVNVPERWSLESYTINDTSGSLRHCDRWHEHASIRHYPEDTGADDIDDYAGITFQCNGDPLVTAASALELAHQTFGYVTDDPDGTDGEGDLPTGNMFEASNSSGFGIIVPRQRSNVAGAPFGSLEFNYGTRSTHTSTRYLHRTIARQDLSDASKIRACAGYPAMSRAVGVVDGTPVDTAAAPNAHIAVYQPTQTPGVVRETDVLI